MKLTERTGFRASTERTDLLELTGRTDLRTSTVHIGLLESTGCTGLQELTKRIGSLKLKEHICSLGLTWGKGLQTLTGHTGLLMFQCTDNKGGNWPSTIENDTIKTLILMSMLIFNKYFCMTKITVARNVQTVCNIKPKLWSQISGPGSAFLVLIIRFKFQGLGS